MEKKNTLEVTGTSPVKKGNRKKKYVGSDWKLTGKTKQQQEKVFQKCCKAKQVYHTV